MWPIVSQATFMAHIRSGGHQWCQVDRRVVARSGHGSCINFSTYAKSCSVTRSTNFAIGIFLVFLPCRNIVHKRNTRLALEGPNRHHTNLV